MEKKNSIIHLAPLVLFLLFILASCSSGSGGGGYYLNSEAEIIFFGFEDPPVEGLINDYGREIFVEVPYGTDVSYLVPEIEVSDGAEIFPASGKAEDFTYPVWYTVVAEDGVTEQDYVVTVLFSQNQDLIFYDDFDGYSLDGGNWHIPTWVSPTDGTYVGRTQFRCSQNSPLPDVEDSNVIIALDTYNPTGYSFYGTDLISNRSFYPDEGIIFTAIAKMDYPVPDGIVGGIFLYFPPSSSSNTLHDEIVFELLSNDEFRVHTNIYGNEPLGAGNPSSYRYAYGSITDYHVYEIEWLPYRVSWYVDGDLIRTVANQSPIPEGPMRVHFNIWVPDIDFSQAYDPDLDYTDYPSLNETFTMSVDYVSVETIY